MKKLSILLVLLWGFVYTFCQSVGIGTTTPAASAILDVQSTNKGALMPRLTSAQRKAIVNPEPGLMVYDIDKLTIVMYDGIKWQRLLFKDSETSELISREVADGEADDHFGNAVCINGDYAVAGAYKDNVNGKSNQGSAIVFHRINGNWVQEAQLFSSDGAAGDAFGYAVAIFGNYIVVGAPDDDHGASTDQGSVYVFARNGTAWTQQHKFFDGGGGINDAFGSSVAMGANQFIVGAPDDDIGANADQGAATIFLLTGNTWANEIKITASDGGANHKFGTAVSMSGNYVMVGAASAPNGSGGNGAAYIYLKIIPPWTFNQKLSTTSPANYFFGGSVSIDGGTAVVTERYGFLSALMGRVHIYQQSGSVWIPQDIIEDVSTNDAFLRGISLSLKGDRLIVGTAQIADVSPDSSYITIYKRTGTAWQEQSIVPYSNNGTIAKFGGAVFIDGFNIIIGAPFRKGKRGEVSFLNIE